MKTSLQRVLTGRLLAAAVIFAGILSAGVYFTERGKVGTLICLTGVILSTAAILLPIILCLMRRTTGLSMALIHSHLSILNVLGRVIAKRDSDTDLHNYRVTFFSVRLAEASGMDKKGIRGLIKGAFLHDVGKVDIPCSILHKPGQLDEGEQVVMRTHVAKGMKIVKGPGWLGDALDVVNSHHEKADGSGYPSGLTGEDTPVAARIFAIADVFDTLISRRPYKEPFSFAETMEIMKKSRGTHFDPELVDIFCKIAGPLYERYKEPTEMILEEDLKKIIERYFSDEFDGILFAGR